MAAEQNRDLLLNPDTYAYMQSEGKGGTISVYCGPGVVNQTGQDKPVVFDQNTRTYRTVDLNQAAQQCPRAGEGDYVILENPATNSAFPIETVQQSANLEKGRKIVIPGPWSKALWPGQSAKVVKGHHLRSNQYLVGMIYNEAEARKNWTNAITKRVLTEGEQQNLETKENLPKENELTVGQRFIIKGTEVSFYIPPTGVEVVLDEKNQYVREAVTLEQLEYCVLISENGQKRFSHGPEVVFPSPTEQFVTDKDNNRKFRAYELNNIQGIHIKVIQEYKEGEKTFKQGEELFITGNDTAIYFPREEHSIIEYGEGNTKHFATAIPAGEARYVMDRTSGKIDLVSGPKMLLPDPRNQVIVRRILSDNQSKLWYPGNDEALVYNQNLRQVSATSPSGRSGLVSEGDYRRSGLRGVQAFASFDAPQIASADLESFGSSDVTRPREAAGGSYSPTKFTRGSTYTAPRQITLDTKYDCVPGINVWTGYAILVVSKTGDRRVVTGPATVLLNYDESLEVLTLSTGKPKNTDSLMRTAYLRTTNNKISDIVEVETGDHVKATLKLSFCVSFEGDSDKWFRVENYVKFLCDHVRSILKGTVKKHDVEGFYQNSLPIIRDAILGVKTDGGPRSGMLFNENGMRVHEVEVLDVTLDNPQIAKMLNEAQYKAVEQNITLHQARKTLEVTQEQQRIKAATAEAEFAAKKRTIELQVEEVAETLRHNLATIESQLTATLKQIELTQQTEAVTNIRNEQQVARNKLNEKSAIEKATAEAEIKLRILEAETKSAVDRLAASQNGMSEAIVALGRQDVLVKVAQAANIDAFLSGNSMEGAISRIFAGMPFLAQIMDQAKAEPKNQNGNRLTAAVN